MSKRKLLLADDSVTVQKVVNLAFESEDIEVITADDGTTAFEKFVEFSPDLVMADINMPGADGYEICERIKQDEATKHIPVLLLVGSFEPFSEEKAARVGAEGFLKKPFQSIGLLINKVTELLDSTVAEESSSEKDFSEADTKPIPVYEPLDDDEFGETGMDDEMIETERVADYSLMDETSKYETTTGFETSSDDDAGKTQPMVYSDIEELGLAEKEEETAEEAVYELADEPDEYSSGEAYGFSEESDPENEESVSGQSESFEEYTDYQPVNEAETAEYPAPEMAKALNFDDLELLELPPLQTFGEPAATDEPQTESTRTEPDYSNFAETTAENSYSTPQPEQIQETAENYQFPTEESAVEFDNSETREETTPEISATAETARETHDIEKSEELSPEDSEKSTTREFISAEETELRAETDSETQAMIAKDIQQEINQASDNKVVVHYLPPEVIDEIAERVVEKLAEKLRR